MLSRWVQLSQSQTAPDILILLRTFFCNKPFKPCNEKHQQIAFQFAYRLSLEAAWHLEKVWIWWQFFWRILASRWVVEPWNCGHSERGTANKTGNQIPSWVVVTLKLDRHEESNNFRPSDFRYVSEFLQITNLNLSRDFGGIPLVWYCWWFRNPAITSWCW